MDFGPGRDGRLRLGYPEAVRLKLDFEKARIVGVVLAKVGNPSRDEALQTSERVFEVEDEDQEMLSGIFLRPFRALDGQRFQHHAALEKHEVNGCAKAVFEDEEQLLERGRELAKRLYSKSNHPNIKSGDLCIALIEGIGVEGEEDPRRALCLLKSESVTPFLSISTRDGDLELHTERGIHPEKIDKGCLVIDHFRHKGYYVLTFDRGGSESRFWVRDFLGVVPISDPALLSERVAELAVAAVSQPAESDDDSPPWDRDAPAREVLGFFEGRKHFSLAEFEEQALRTPEAKTRFAEERRRLEEDEGVKLEDEFEVSKRGVTKARKKLKSVMKLDSGVELRLKPKVALEPDEVLEQGYDEQRGMKFIKVYFRREIGR